VFIIERAVLSLLNTQASPANDAVPRRSEPHANDYRFFCDSCEIPRPIR
jgi:hypothetical protein